MWDLPRYLLIQKARHAIKDGRIDEAYSTLMHQKVRDHRQRQILIEKLVEPFLDRAQSHLAASRLEEALADVERAQEAGGHRSKIAALRDEVLAALKRVQLGKRGHRAVLSSARRRLAEGRVAAVAEVVANLDTEHGGTEELRREVRRRGERADSARSRAERCLDDGDMLLALDAAVTAFQLAARDPSTRELEARVRRDGEASLRAALESGVLRRALPLAHKLRGVVALSDEGEELVEIVQLVESAAQAAAACEWRAARLAMDRVKAMLPGASWIAACLTQLQAVEENQHVLQAGPLGLVAAAGADWPSPASVQPRRDVELPGSETVVAPVSPAGPAPAGPGAGGSPPGKPADAGGNGRAAAAPSTRRFTLWVDGVGSYLLVKADRITFGRAGSSARPDIALPADLEGIHAEILRVDHDYFLVPRAPVTVNGKEITRHLLADGDSVVLGKRSRFVFRMPTRLSTTAILELGSGLRLDDDVRRVVLVDQLVVLKGDGGSHVESAPRAHGKPSETTKVVLNAGADGFRCVASSPVHVDGSAWDSRRILPLGGRVEVGCVSFTLTAARSGSPR